MDMKEEDDGGGGGGNDERKKHPKKYKHIYWHAHVLHSQHDDMKKENKNTQIIII